MDNTNDLYSTNNLIAAFTNYITPQPVIFEYRVYFDKGTRECTIKTIYQPEGEFVVVTRKEYDDIAFVPNYRITPSGKIEKKPIDFSASIVLQLQNTGYRTTKNNNIFVVPELYTQDIDYWGLRNE